MTNRRRSGPGASGQIDRQRSVGNRDNLPKQTEAESGVSRRAGGLPAEVIEALVSRASISKAWRQRGG
jgi:hypothetical protein